MECLLSPVIQFARLSGFSPIIATASGHNHEYLKSLGATYVIDRNLPADQLQAEATKLAGGLFDLVYDAVSLPETLPLANALTAPEGDLVVVSPTGLPQGDETSKRVHLARGLLVLPTNHVAGASLLANITSLLEGGEIKVGIDESPKLPPLNISTHASLTVPRYSLEASALSPLDLNVLRASRSAGRSSWCCLTRQLELT